MVVYRAPMVFRSISIWRVVGIRGVQEVIFDLLLADSECLRTALACRRRVQFGLLQVPILTIEDVILLKIVAGRLQDRADLERLVRQDELQIDWGYVESWKTKLSLRG